MLQLTFLLLIPKEDLRILSGKDGLKLQMFREREFLGMAYISLAIQHMLAVPALLLRAIETTRDRCLTPYKNQQSSQIIMVGTSHAAML